MNFKKIADTSFKQLVKGNMYWNSDNKVAEKCPSTHCSNPPKGSWGLRY